MLEAAVITNIYSLLIFAFLSSGYRVIIFSPDNKLSEFFFATYAAFDKFNIKKLIFLPDFFSMLPQIVLIVKFQ